MQPIYLDHNATAPLDPEVREAMMPYLGEVYGNASSVHGFWRAARQAVDEARTQVAALIHAKEREVVFTSGGTEADNQALRGVLDVARPKGGGTPHILTTAVEHHAVLHTARALEKRGARVTYLPVDATGRIDPEELAGAITEDTILISVMLANNEIGTLQPVAEAARIAREHGIPIHTDAVQALGRVPVDVEQLGVDLLSLSGHKIYGPKGIGALYVRRGTRIGPLIFGGHHERRRRAGTENVPGIVGLGKACELAGAQREASAAREAALRDSLQEGILAAVPEVRVNGHPTLRLPNTLNLGFRFVEGEALLLHHDLEGIALSTGSACSSGDLEASHVLLAMGLPHEEAHGTLRYSLGRWTTAEEIERTIEVTARVVERVRAISPVYQYFLKQQPRSARETKV
jgi:cysteine desulfurase